jgi:speckle-type POZ protein
MLFHTKVYAVADKYCVPALKKQAKEKFESAVEACWDMDDFPHVVPEVYAASHTKDRNLRDVVVSISHEHIKDLLQKQNFLRVLENTPNFAADVTRRVAGGPKWTHKYRCPNCNTIWEANLKSEEEYYCIHCGEPTTDWHLHHDNQG